MELTEKMEKMIEIIKRNDSDLKATGCNSFFAPDIPEKIKEKIIKNFDSYLAINKVLAFYDSTIFESAKTGIIFVSDGFYYRWMMTKAIFFQYKDIKRMYVSKADLVIETNSMEMPEYTMIDETFDMRRLKHIIEELKEIDAMYGDSSIKTTGKVKKLDLPPEMLEKCNGIIHTASVACGGVGAAGAQIPASDNAVIVPIQIGMIVGLGGVFELHVTESTAKSIIASAGATIVGRTASQFLVGWIPFAGNAINTATAAGLTEAIGWIAVKNFYERWVEDRNKGRYGGMKEGYTQASEQYEQKFRNQEEGFRKEREEFKETTDRYEKFCDQVEKEGVSSQEKNRNKGSSEYTELKRWCDIYMR